MKCFKNCLLVIYIIAFCSFTGVAYAGYSENLYVEGLYHSSQTPSTGVVRLENDYIDNLGVFQYRAAAEVSSNLSPYVKSENGGVAGLQYDVFIKGAPNTSLVLNMTSLYKTSHIYELNVSNGYNELSLGIGIFDSVGTNYLDYRFISSADQVGYLFNPYPSGYILPTFTSINDTEIFTTLNEYKWTTIDPILGTFQYEVSDKLQSSFLVNLGESGEAWGQVSLSVRGTNAYLDPFFSIDPNSLALNPNASLSFTPGVGNLNPLAAVPEPETYAMMLLGLGLIGFTTRRISL